MAGSSRWFAHRSISSTEGEAQTGAFASGRSAGMGPPDRVQLSCNYRRRVGGLPLPGLMMTAVGVHRMTIHKWERGRHRPRGNAALHYAQVLEELMQR